MKKNINNIGRAGVKSRPKVILRSMFKYQVQDQIICIVTSHISRRGNIFGSVRLSVCLFALCRLKGWTYVPKIWLMH